LRRCTRRYSSQRDEFHQSGNGCSSQRDEFHQSGNGCSSQRDDARRNPSFVREDRGLSLSLRMVLGWIEIQIRGQKGNSIRCLPKSARGKMKETLERMKE
jgi:hypothetical protein